MDAFLAGCEFVDPAERLRNRRLPIVYHTFEKPKNRGLLVLEFTMDAANASADAPNFLLLTRSDGQPTPVKGQFDQAGDYVGAFQISQLQPVKGRRVETRSCVNGTRKNNK